MTHHLNSDKTVAVADDYYWQDIDSCPRGVKVQLLGYGGVAVYGIYRCEKFYTQWAPMPQRRRSDKE